MFQKMCDLQDYEAKPHLEGTDVVSSADGAHRIQLLERNQLFLDLSRISLEMCSSLILYLGIAFNR